MSELRPLSAPEHAVLTAVLSRQSPGLRPALSAQARSASATETSTPHMLDLIVGDQASPVSVGNGPLPGRTLVVTADGQLTGEIVVWVQDGLLSALEYAWYTDDPPTAWPEPNELSFG